MDLGLDSIDYQPNIKGHEVQSCRSAFPNQVNPIRYAIFTRKTENSEGSTSTYDSVCQMGGLLLSQSIVLRFAGDSIPVLDFYRSTSRAK